MSRRTEIGSRVHSSSGAANRNKDAFDCRESVTRAARTTLNSHSRTAVRIQRKLSGSSRAPFLPNGSCCGRKG